ncbi:MAG: regulatory protein RecX [Peptococcaceae bacterium]|nr:regulatory protein RecX [Peptococcaceae bacterium]
MKNSGNKNAMDIALSRLSRSQTTVLQLRKYLERKGFDLGNINETIKKLVEWNYVNDKEYALAFIRTKRNKFSKKKTIIELQRAGVDQEQTSTLLDEYYTDEHEYQNCLRFAQKIWQTESIKWEKYKNLAKYQHIIREAFLKKKVGDKLLMRGFSFDIVKNVLANEFSGDI